MSEAVADAINTAPRETESSAYRADLLLISDMIEEGARVLDIGCDDGALLSLLAERQNVDGRGIELSQAGVNACVARGLSVIQGDADQDLATYPDGAFDYVILSQTIQATRRPDHVLREIVRIGRNAIVSFPNFGHWRVRISLLATGRMPMTTMLSQPWYVSENIRLCTIRDFFELCAELGISIERAAAVSGRTHARPIAPGGRLANLFAEEAILLLRSESSSGTG